MQVSKFIDLVSNSAQLYVQVFDGEGKKIDYHYFVCAHYVEQREGAPLVIEADDLTLTVTDEHVSNATDNGTSVSVVVDGLTYKIEFYDSIEE